MDLSKLKDGDKLRVIRCGQRSVNWQWGFRPGDEVTVTAQRPLSDQPDNTVAVRRDTGMLGFFGADEVMLDPKVGDRVRSHDFNNVGEDRGPGRNPCYIEGVLRAIDDGFYNIQVDGRVWDGERDTALLGGETHAPVNGTFGTLGGLIYRVEPI
jgi:hypothetical protein